MNFQNNIKYLIYKTPADGGFKQMVESLLGMIPGDIAVFRLVFFGSPADNGEYLECRDVINRCVSTFFHYGRPVSSFVAQPPLDAGLVMEVHAITPCAGDNLCYKEYDGRPYVIFEDDEVRVMFAGGVQDDLSLGIYGQSRNVFHHIGKLLDSEGFGINAITRQWNYIEGITSCCADGQHYQMFNNARSEFYSLTGWDNGYPAATGIGSRCGGVLIDFDAFVPKTARCRITPIDNKLQVAAHEYSANVLLEAGKRKTTPKFERAKSVSSGDGRLVYISGTAAIRGEESLTGVGIERQLVTTLENIGQLTGDAGVRLLRVYLKDAAGYGPVRQYLDQNRPDTYISYLTADVCRDELLIEIEGIAIE